MTKVSNLCGMTLPATAQYKLSHNYSMGSLSNSRYLEADDTSVGFLLVDCTIDASTGGVVVTQAADPDGMARPASLSAAKGTNEHWTTGDYAYDGGGNVSDVVGSPGLATPTDSATNRLEGSAAYNDAGNLTSWFRITGVRVPTSSSANPGKTIDVVIDISRFR